MLAAPEFRFGAMENWGIVIYAEQRMLYNVSSDNPPTGQQVAMIIGHELVHQWFGNMVTMDWWSDTWLNEAFASYFEFVAVDEVEPTWDIFEQFFQGDATFMALQDDAEADSHPTVMDVGWLPDIWKMFDSRGYQRGACMARMMQAFLGDEVFYEGLRNYVRDFMYKNAISDDVYRYLTEASIGRSNVDVKEVMDPWMLQKGYPLVTITRTTDTTAVADQKPYSNDPNGEGFGPSWYVPLTYTHSGRMIVDNPKHVWMRKSSADLELSDAEDDDWILGNINQLGFFRVNYDADNWEKLIAQLIEDHKKIPLANRAALVDDVFSMSQSMDIDAVTALRVGYYLKKEEDYTPIKAVIIHLDFFKSMLERTTAYGYYKKYIQNMFRPMYDKLGWNFTYENHVDYHLRKSAVESACYTDYGPCIDTATSIYKRWIDGQGEYKIADDIIEVVMCSAIKAGTENDWRFALSMLHSTSALACTKDFTLIKEYMEESLHMSDIFTTLGYIKQQSAIGYHLAWEFLMDNFELLVHVKEESAYKAVWEFAGNMNRGKDLAMLEQFGRTYSHMPSLEVSSFYQSLNKVKLNIAWMDKNYNAVYDWLKGISAEDG
ncbi:aminopeptidase N-like [Saccoglossus kowalevskii]